MGYSLFLLQPYKIRPKSISLLHPLLEFRPARLQFPFFILERAELFLRNPEWFCGSPIGSELFQSLFQLLEAQAGRMGFVSRLCQVCDAVADGLGAVKLACL